MDVLGRMAVEVGIPAGQKGSAEQYDLMAVMLRPTDTAPDSGTDGVPPTVEGPVAQEAADGQLSAASDPLQERIDRANKRAAAAKPSSPQTVDAPEVAEPLEMAL